MKLPTRSPFRLWPSRSNRRIVGGIVLLGASAIMMTASAVAFAPGYLHVSLKKAKNPAQLFKTNRWVRAYAGEDAVRLPRDARIQFGQRLKDKVCTLTFDDGPHPAVTPYLTAQLEQLRVPATFFVIGKMVDRYPYLVQMEAANGFEIGNHSYSHVTLTRLEPRSLMTEFKACDMAVEAAAGVRPRFCRPPGGDVDLETARAASANGLTTTLWSDDPGDYAIHSEERIFKQTVAHLRPGAIILLHDGNMDTVKALPKIVAWARARGYRFVPLKDIPATQVS